MRRHLTFLLLAGLVALSACRSKPKKKVAELPVEPPLVGHSGKVTVRSTEGAGEDSKKPRGGAKPKSGPPEAAPVPPVPKPPVEPKPTVVAKPASVPAPPPAPSHPPKVKAVEVAKPGGAPERAPVKVPVETRPVQPSVSVPPVEAGQGSRPPAAKVVPAPSGAPAPAAASVPPAASKPAASPPPTEPLPKTTRSAKPAEGRAVELSIPAKPPATAPAAEPLRTAIPPAAAVPAKSAAGGPILGLLGTEPRPRAGDSRPLPLPTGGGGNNNAAASPPLALQFGSGTNNPPATNDALRAIGVDPLLQGTAWREQQLARQAAEQKAREEEQRKLKGALYRFLFKGGTNSN